MCTLFIFNSKCRYSNFLTIQYCKLGNMYLPNCYMIFKIFRGMLKISKKSCFLKNEFDIVIFLGRVNFPSASHISCFLSAILSFFSEVISGWKMSQRAEVSGIEVPDANGRVFKTFNFISISQLSGYFPAFLRLLNYRVLSGDLQFCKELFSLSCGF